MKTLLTRQEHEFEKQARGFLKEKGLLGLLEDFGWEMEDHVRVWRVPGSTRSGTKYVTAVGYDTVLNRWVSFGSEVKPTRVLACRGFAIRTYRRTVERAVRDDNIDYKLRYYKIPR